MSTEEIVASSDPEQIDRTDKLARLQRAAQALGNLEGSLLPESQDLDVSALPQNLFVAKAKRIGEALGVIGDNLAELQIKGMQATQVSEVPPVTLTPEQSKQVVSKLGLVRSVVFQVSTNFPKHVDRGELESAGQLGLINATMRYDEGKGDFDTYAAQRIRGAILDHLRSLDWAPRSVRHKARRIENAQQELASVLHRMPTNRELAEHLQMSLEEMEEFKTKWFNSVVLDLEHHLNDEAEDLTLAEVLADTRELDPSIYIENREEMAFLKDALMLLSNRHQHVLIAYYLEGRISEEIAKELGVTESRVSQIRSEAIERIRSAMTAQYKDTESSEGKKTGLLGRRRKAFAEQLSRSTAWKDRIS